VDQEHENDVQAMYQGKARERVLSNEKKAAFPHIKEERRRIVAARLTRLDIKLRQRARAYKHAP
jgi:hypothetical protein